MIQQEEKNNLIQLVNSYEENFTNISIKPDMPFKAEANFAIQQLLDNEYLMRVAINNKTSLRSAVNNIAACGLSLNPIKKHAYLVPRKKMGGVAVCLDISYIGLLQLATDSGSIEWVRSEIVRKNHSFKYKGNNTLPEHEYDPFATDNGEVTGVYTIAKTTKGDCLVDTMSILEVNNIRDKSESYKNVKSRPYSPWVTFYEEMVKKTAIRRAYKLWPKTNNSIFLEQAIGVLNSTEGIDFKPEKTSTNGNMTKSITLGDKIIDLIPEIPENEKIHGPDFRIRNGMYNGKQLKDIDFLDLENYRDDTLLKKKEPKGWELELIAAIGFYIEKNY